jgi:L-alanine-DL-glutamate epimerase-like enolase superfamily enzyme
VINHFYTNGIGLAAGLHFLASRKSAFILEYCVEDTPIRWDITRQKMEMSDGCVHVPEGPGLGIDLNEETIERYRLN